MEPKKIKIILFGGRHTGQGPISRAWGKTDADLPALQPVCIYERETDMKGEKVVVAAWVLSLDPEFDYMRKSMYLNSDAFIYTFDTQSQPEKSLKYIESFIDEVRDTLDPMPLQVLVGSKLDPTLSRPDYLDALVEGWMEKFGRMPYFEIDLTDSRSFFRKVDDIFAKVLSMI
ncbi:MAG: hypothetical protein ACFFCS_17575 [Candidatus Hodarchaeota archaeon]